MLYHNSAVSMGGTVHIDEYTHTITTAERVKRTIGALKALSLIHIYVTEVYHHSVRIQLFGTAIDSDNPVCLLYTSKFEISDARKIAKTLSAFANTDGGKLLIGVKDNGKIAGVRSDEEQYMIEAAAGLYCSPEVNYTMHVYKRQPECITTPRKQCPTIRIGSSINKKEREDTMMMLNFDFVLRLLVAGILGAIIGLDREYRAKEAGYRTHFLVSRCV